MTDRDWMHRSPLAGEHGRALGLVFFLTIGVMLAEAAGGWLANSLALLADAGHLLADGVAIGLALFAAWAARRPATPEKTYGYLRLEILAALANGAALFGISALIVWEAWRRFRSPPAVEPGILFGVATVGLVANLFAMRLLHRGHDHSLNVKGVYLHVVGDLLGSMGALGAGLVIFTTGWTRIDALVSVAISVLILFSAWRLVKDSVDVLLEGTPRHISLPEVERRIASIDGVAGVHDLHVWTVTSGVVAMSGHAVVSNPAANQRVLETVQSRLADLGINHVTLQIERDDTCAEP